MSTRAVIARMGTEHEGAFSGRYHHWDGYPSGLGATLFEARRRFFDGDTDAMLRYLIDEHPAGWSTINGADLTLPARNVDTSGHSLPCVICGKPGPAHLCQTFGADKHLELGLPYPCGTNYAEHLRHPHQVDPAAMDALRAIPNCYCHGRADVVPDRAYAPTTDVDAAGAGCEWAYVLDGSTMLVLASRNDDGSKMVGMFGMGNAAARWPIVARVDLDGEAPDWEAIERHEYAEPIEPPSLFGGMSAEDFTTWRAANMAGGD